MRVAEYCLILFSLFLNSNGLNCKSEGGPKENELKNIYNTCIKQQNKNNSNTDDIDQDWKETRRYNQWSEDNVAKNRENKNNGYGMDGESQGKGHRMNNRDRGDERRKMSPQDDKNKNRDRMQHRERDSNENMNSRDARGEVKDNYGDNRMQRNNGMDARNDFPQNDNFNGYNNQYSTQPSRRYKREGRVEVNSGRRSQYNPNPQRFSGNEGKYKDEGKNSSKINSTSDDSNNTCALHCLLENLQMTDESGMPDRYLMTHAFTKDVKDEDLKDFLQEAIEECFQILDNENTNNKCEFSKNLLMCLSGKGKDNCDDWKGDFQF